MERLIEAYFERLSRLASSRFGAIL